MMAVYRSVDLAYLKLAWIVTLCMVLCCFMKPVNAATATATVTANIVITMSLTTQSNIAFGDVSAGSTSGTVILSTQGNRTSTGGTTINSGQSGSQAEFSATGEPGAVFSVSKPASIQLTSASNNTMVVDNFISEPANGGQLDASGNKTVLVGATLHVSSHQAFGSYTGLMVLNVDYN